MDRASNPAVVDFGGFNRLVAGREAVYIANANDFYVGRSLVLYGEYCEEEYALLRQMCGEGSVVADVGANSGAHAVRLAKRVGLTGRLLAFEPQPVLFQALCGTMALNSQLNADCRLCALGAGDGTVRIPSFDYRQPGNFGAVSPDAWEGGSGTAVPLHRLDGIFDGDRLDLLKIDVEGAELQVLMGGFHTIQRFRPVIYLENDRRENSPALIGWLREAGYRMWWHRPRLFNPANFFGHRENVFGGTASLNMLAVPSDRNAVIPLPEVGDAEDFPAVAIDAPPSASACE